MAREQILKQGCARIGVAGILPEALAPRGTIAGVPGSAPIWQQGDQADFANGLTLPDGRYVISVMADGYKLDGAHFSMPLGDAPVPVELQPPDPPRAPTNLPPALPDPPLGPPDPPRGPTNLPRGLPDALLVLDQRDAHEALTALAEAGAGQIGRAHV